jgi:restriction system-associated AAA family ATPase
MKLYRLQINTPFRSLPVGFEIYFLRDFDQSAMWDFMPYCLVGRNGSGKSNVLEAIAAIFYHIECTYLENHPEGFDKDEENPDGFDSTKCSPDAFELEYYIPISIELIKKTAAELGSKQSDENVYAHIFIRKQIGERPSIEWLNRAEYDPNGEINLNRTEVRQLTPQYIVGYSSGENEILSLPFFKMRFIHFDEYTYRLINQYGYSAPEGRLVYIDSTYSQAVFLTNYLMQDPSVLRPIYDTLGIESILDFRIIINRKIAVEEKVNGLFDSQHFDSEHFATEASIKTYQLTPQVDDDIERLRKCATAYYDAPDGSLYLDYFINDATKSLFQFHFENDPLRLFQTFQTLLTLNLYDVSFELKQDLYQSDSLYVNETVPVLASDKRVMRFKELTIKKKGLPHYIASKSLSDGEHQYLHAMGLCLLFKNTNTLFLLDEPETHFNPDWRAKFISTLRDCLRDENKVYLRDLLITSHSPFIISDCKPENVLIFKRDEGPNTERVTYTRPDFNTFGASVNFITLRIFGKMETIGSYANSTIKDLEKRLEAGEEGSGLINEANRILGDSVEKIIFINKVLDSQKQ